MTSPSRIPTVSDVVALIDELYPPHLAESWDSVGLIVGDPDASVHHIRIGLDPVAETVADALTAGADFLLTHHPLYLRGTNSVAATTGKGRVVHTLIRAGVALMNAHTNADAQVGGVADTLADLVGMVPEREVLEPIEGDPTRGIGRVGDLAQPVTLEEFAARVAAVLPATPAGVTWAGEADQPVRRVAVSPGAGDSLLAAATRAGVDAYVTADLRHHPASEHLADGGPALVTGSHYATEWPWVRSAGDLVLSAAAARGWDIEVSYSPVVSEPWTGHISTKEDHS